MRTSRRRRGLRRRRLWGLTVLAALALFAALWWRPALVLNAEFARQRWLAGAQEHAAQAAGHRWVWLEAGAGPPLLLVHGFTGSKENWLPLMGELAEQYRVIAPDLPGWGDSQRIAGADYGFAEQAARLQAFIEQVAPGQQVRLVGHSMGGGIAAIWAGQRPQALQALVLLDAAGVPFDNAFARAVAAGEHPFEVTDAASLQRQLDLVFDYPPWIPWPADRALIAQRRAQSGFEREVLRAIAGDPQRAFAPGEAARGISAPTLLLWCRADRIIDAAASQAYAERIAGSRQQWLQDCNHMPMMEQPQDTAAALLAFFAAR